MHSAYSILTRRFKGLDINVWLTLLIVTVIAGGVLVFRFVTDKKIEHFDILATDVSGSQKNALFVNEEVTFTAKTSGTVVWDFGDGANTTGTSVKHTFLTEGKQVVTATLDRKFSDTLVLNIQRVVNKDSTPVVNPIQGPTTVTANKAVTFFYDGKNKETAIQWYILNQPNYPIVHSEKAKYTFVSEGTQTLVLQLNNDPNKTFNKTITILPAASVADVPPPVARPPSPSGEPKKPAADTPSRPKPKPVEPQKTADYLSDDGFASFLTNNVVAGKSTGQEIYKYLCNNTATQVMDNGNSSTMDQLLKKLYKGRFKNIKVTTERDAQRCVNVLSVTYTKKGIL
jgi:hypothetical protein